MAPDDPQVLNTQCYVLAELGRGAEAIPYCRPWMVVKRMRHSFIRDFLRDLSEGPSYGQNSLDHFRSGPALLRRSDFSSVRVRPFLPV